MATQLQKLFFSIDLLDRVTGPVGRIQKRMNKFASGITANFGRIGAGALGIAGAGLALEKMVRPAIDVNRALGEVKSLDVTQAALDRLSDTAVDFTMAFGGAAADFIRSAYDIQSAIGGLTGGELSAFTNASNILAKGTKADAATITDYMGTMYGIFKNTADAMGKAQWVEQLTGQTAAAVRMFKTTGGEMASSFESLGASATSAGIAAAEQMAVLGRLQATMSGSEAGTKYQAFLNNIGGAQEKLGLSFTAGDGSMLGIVDILEKIRGKFGETLDVAESDALKKAFGSDEAVDLLKLLMADTDGLAASIDKLGKVTGMETAVKMAEAMTDPWQRLGAVAQSVRIIFAQALLPAINPVIERMAEGGKTIARWTKMFPNLTRWIGYGAMAIIGLTGVLGALAVMAGVVNLVLLANPIVWVVGAVMLLIGAVAAAILFWDKLKAALMDNTGFRMVAGIIGGILDWYKLLGSMVMGLVDKIMLAIKWWGNLKDTVLNFDWMDWLGNKFDWLSDKLDWIPGFGKDGDAAASSPTLSAPRQAHVPPGGISKQITQSIVSNRSASNQRTIGTVNINTTSRITPAALDEMLFMGAP